MPVVTPQDLADLLGQDVQEDRARMIIVQAEALCRAVVSPLPEGAGAVVLSVAARAYANPQGIVAETVGPYSVQRPHAQAGLYMTRDERRSLKLMAGRGGAFSINPTPPGAGAPPGRPASWDLPWWYDQ
ncbi:hypothetical protein B7P34_06745 [Streptosporangium nondiastaticum]|uniref:Uncharacterized protein n=1 Tax=Streptosporangium nondiastaticum TaxID=35764 RepID=A0A9X7PIV3_9ACTN|nr:hypothetical protein [Streptosporangium nondiastaticum]PSJ29560.1 hypothetical protein B7P34_06745 [Streptosporangium nondiastaticum]